MQINQGIGANLSDLQVNPALFMENLRDSPLWVGGTVDTLHINPT